MKTKFKVGDIVEVSGEGSGRFWRIVNLQATGAFLFEADVPAGAPTYSCGWKNFSSLTLAKVVLRERIRESKKAIQDAERELRAISRNPAKYAQTKSER